MPFDGSGNYSRVYDWTDDRDNGIKIQAARMDGEFDDIAAAFNVVFFRNGLVPMTGDLAMGANDIKGIASGTASAPSVQFSVDPNTGMYLEADTVLGFSANGTKRFTVETTGASVTGVLNVSGAAVVAGALSAPTLATTGNVTVGNNILVTGSVTGATGIFTALTVGGSAVWTAGNDGSGSGLDADTLDGLQGSSYGQLSAAQTWTATNTFNGLLKVTGGAYPGNNNTGIYHDATSGLVLFGTGTTGDILLANKNGSTIFEVATGTAVVNFAGTPTVAGSTVWHAGNDGSGSGLDADTVDGVQAAAFALLAGATFSGNVGIGVAPSFPLDVAGAGVNFAVRSTDTNNATFRGYVNGVERGKMAFTNTGTVLFEANGTQSMVLASTGLAITGTLSSTGAMTVAGSTVWHAGNDGSGSGLDADTVDGVQASAFTTKASITDGTAAPSGGSDGDIYFQYT